MSVFVVDPVRDPRWGDFVGQHPRSSVFHSPSWLEALDRTYGWSSSALTTATPGEPIRDGLPFCRVNTLLSKRLVSLPFSDHCEPLVERREDLLEMLTFLAGDAGGARSCAVELRPRGDVASPVAAAIGPGCGFTATTRYVLHTLDLTPPLELLSRGFHPSCMRRPIRRAEREGLTYEAGQSERLLAAFYGLLTRTRRRHGLPPPPRKWFENLIALMKGALTIHVASKGHQPLAAILTLAHGTTLTYKYGGSDARFHSLGAMPYLFWQAIRDAKQRGFLELDLGRSDLDQPGLIAFKDHFGARRSTVTYYHYPAGQARVEQDDWRVRAARRVFARLPLPALSFAGRLLYRHFG